MLLLYAYCVGIPSSRRIERACWEDAAFRVLTGNQQPDHSRISDFRRVHLDALAGLFVQVLSLCQKAGLVSLGNVALDGRKVRANVSADNEVGQRPRGLTRDTRSWPRPHPVSGMATDPCRGIPQAVRLLGWQLSLAASGWVPQSWRSFTALESSGTG